ncbi:36776_t:CDS:2, partial [Racocetra persica]
EDLAAIVNEWKNMKGEDIYSLRMAFQQATQMERSRIARLESVARATNDNEPICNIAPNTKIICK